MPQIVTCPDCGRKLKVPDDLLGKKVKCPGCGQKFVGESADAGTDDAEESPPPRRSGVTTRSGAAPRAGRRDDPDDENDDRPKSRRRDDEEEEDEDYPVRTRRDDDRPEPTKGEIRTGWERVRFGINLIIIALWIGVGAAAVGLIGQICLVLFGVASFGSTMSSLLSSAGSSTPQDQAHQMGGAVGNMAGTGVALIVGGCLVGGLVVLLSLGATACSMTGEGFCMGIASTRKTQTLKVLAIVVFCLSCATLLLPMVSYGGGALFLRNGGGCLILGGDGLFLALLLAEVICFLLFLRGVAVVMKKHGVAQNIVFYMISLPVYALTLPIVPAIFIVGTGAAVFNAVSSANTNNASAAAGNAAGSLGAAFIGGLTCAGVEFLIGVGLFVWYMVLLHQVRSAVDGWLDRN